MGNAKENREESYVDELAPGTQLLQGQFKIEEFLNSGGFGITYLARDSLDRPVVIKECFPSSFCHRSRAIVAPRSKAHQKELKSVVDLFVQEARSLAKLDHPNIVGVHQVFEENATAYMVLDFVEGRDLLDMLESEDHGLTAPQIKGILKDVLGAVAYIHDQDILHRDISPDNILVDGELRPVLIDFGAAREEATKKSRVLSAMRVVKDGYSPQEFYVQGSAQSPSSDLYALGATFYHLIEGNIPPNSQARLAAIAANEADPYDPLAGRLKGHDKKFLGAIDKALQILPKDRLQSAQDWMDMMEGGRNKSRLITTPTAPISSAAAATAKAEEGGKSKLTYLLGTAAVIAIIAVAGLVGTGKLDLTGGSDAQVVDATSDTPLPAELAAVDETAQREAELAAAKAAEEEAARLAELAAAEEAAQIEAAQAAAKAAEEAEAARLAEIAAAEEAAQREAALAAAKAAEEEAARQAEIAAAEAAAEREAELAAAKAAEEAEAARLAEVAAAEEAARREAELAAAKAAEEEAARQAEIAAAQAAAEEAEAARLAEVAAAEEAAQREAALAAAKAAEEEAARQAEIAAAEEAAKREAELAAAKAAEEEAARQAEIAAAKATEEAEAARLANIAAAEETAKRGAELFAAKAVEEAEAARQAEIAAAEEAAKREAELAAAEEAAKREAELAAAKAAEEEAARQAEIAAAEEAAKREAELAAAKAAEEEAARQAELAAAEETTATQTTSVLSAWSLDLPFKGQGGSNVIGEVDTVSPDWAATGTRILSVNGTPIERMSDIARVLRTSTLDADSKTQVVTLELETPDGTQISDKEWEFPIVQQTALVNGTQFVTRFDGEAWKTVVTASTGGPDSFQVGDEVIALMSTNETLDGRTSMKSILERELADGKEQFSFAVSRTGSIWVVSLTYSGGA